MKLILLLIMFFSFDTFSSEGNHVAYQCKLSEQYQAWSHLPLDVLEITGNPDQQVYKHAKVNNEAVIIKAGYDSTYQYLYHQVTGKYLFGLEFLTDELDQSVLKIYVYDDKTVLGSHRIALLKCHELIEKESEINFDESKTPKFYGAIITSKYKNSPDSQMGLTCKVYNYKDKEKCDIYEAFYKERNEWVNLGKVFANKKDQLVTRAHRFHLKNFNSKMGRTYYRLTFDMASFCFMGMGIICPVVPVLAVGQIAAAPFVGLYHLIGLSISPFSKKKIKKAFELMENRTLAGTEVEVRNKYFSDIYNSM